MRMRGLWRVGRGRTVERWPPPLAICDVCDKGINGTVVIVRCDQHGPVGLVHVDCAALAPYVIECHVLAGESCEHELGF